MVQRQSAQLVLDRDQPGEVRAGSRAQFARRGPEISVALSASMLQEEPMGLVQPTAAPDRRFDDRLQPGVVEGDLMEPAIRSTAARKRMCAVCGPEPLQRGALG